MPRTNRSLNYSIVVLLFITQGPYWSLMFEVSESQFKPLAQQAVELGGTAGTW
jgi:hypothetical protein